MFVAAVAFAAGSAIAQGAAAQDAAQRGPNPAPVRLAAAAVPHTPAPVDLPAARPPRPDAAPLDPETALTLALGEAGSRMTVPVRVAGRGPWGFVIDTGSERTVIGRELAGVLRLPPGPSVRVTAMTGTAPAATVRVPHLIVGEDAEGSGNRGAGRSGSGRRAIRAGAVDAPVFGTRDIGAAGLLGVDALQGHRVTLDFDAARMTVEPAGRARGAASDEIVVTARSRYGQLIVTDARLGGRRAAVIVDTGSPVSVGNTALLAALGRRPRGLGQVEAVSVTGDALVAPAYSVDAVRLGDVTLNGVAVAVADLAPFARFGLTDRPALLLGMDVLRLFRRVQIDFANREIRFRLPRRPG